jgi:hypothetical protein
MTVIAALLVRIRAQFGLIYSMVMLETNSSGKKSPCLLFFYLGHQGGEASVGLRGRGEREGEEGGDVPRGEAAAERDGEADGAGDPADLLGQGAGLDHGRDLLQIWHKRRVSHAKSGEFRGGRARVLGRGRMEWGSLRWSVESAGAAAAGAAAGGGAAGWGSESFICTSSGIVAAARRRRMWWRIGECECFLPAQEGPPRFRVGLPLCCAALRQRPAAVSSRAGGPPAIRRCWAWELGRRIWWAAGPTRRLSPCSMGFSVPSQIFFFFLFF